MTKLCLDEAYAPRMDASFASETGNFFYPSPNVNDGYNSSSAGSEGQRSRLLGPVERQHWLACVY